MARRTARSLSPTRLPALVNGFLAQDTGSGDHLSKAAGDRCFAGATRDVRAQSVIQLESELNSPPATRG
jgi:hypothetical protein